MDGICRHLEINCLQLVDVFKDPKVPVEECFFVDEGHWTERGHAVAARERSLAGFGNRLAWAWFHNNFRPLSTLEYPQALR